MAQNTTIASGDSSNKSSGKAMHIALWVVQVLLAAMYLMAGSMKTFTPIDQLMQKMPGMASVPEALVRFIGVSELAGALGLLLPSLLRIKPQLTPLAALGLFAIQVLAIAFHIMQGEAHVIGFNIVLAVAAAFIWWGRRSAYPISAK